MGISLWPCMLRTISIACRTIIFFAEYRLIGTALSLTKVKNRTVNTGSTKEVIHMIIARNISIYSIIFSAFSLFLLQPAYAYLDPGTGSLIIQVIVGSIAALGVAMTAMRHRIVDFLNKFLGRKLKNEKDNVDDPNS